MTITGDAADAWDVCAYLMITGKLTGGNLAPISGGGPTTKNCFWWKAPTEKILVNVPKIFW